MRKILLILFVSISAMLHAQYPVLEIGSEKPASETMVSAVNNESYNLDEMVGDNGLLVIFSCNTCPFVIAWEDRYPKVNELAKKNKVGFALLNSNCLKRDKDDSFEAMQKHAEKYNYEWPYLLDKGSKFANALGAQTTPHVFLFDKDLKLVYKGAIDDNHKDAAEVEDFYLKDALKSLGKGETIQNKETRNLGCSIKRKTS